MSNGLIALAPQNTDLTTEDKYFKDLSSSGNFLPRIQLYTGASGPVKSNLFPMNHWGMARGKDDITDLGKEVQVIPVAMRFKALDLRGGNILNYFDPSTETFQAIKALSTVADSECMCGTEFLMWLPEVGEFCTFFAYNTSSKREAPKIRALINQAAVLSSKFVKNDKEPKKSFQAMQINASSITPENLPDADIANEEVSKFKNAKDSQVVAASAAESAAMDRPQ